MQVQADSGKSGAEKNVRNEGVALGAFAVSGAGEKRTWPRRHGLAKYELWGAVWTAGKRHICTTERSLALVWVLSGLGFVRSGLRGAAAGSQFDAAEVGLALQCCGGFVKAGFGLELPQVDRKFA